MTYDYICTACNHVWEAEQRISEAALKDCPACSGATARRQISGGAGFILKGGGWYSDLYSSSGKKAGSEESSGGSSTSSTSTSTAPSTAATATATVAAAPKPAAAPATAAAE